MPSKNEILDQYDDETLENIFSSYYKNPEWKEIFDGNEEYAEGDLYRDHVRQHISSGRLFQWTSCTNSWADLDTEFDRNDIIEVEEYEQVIKSYRKVQDS